MRSVVEWLLILLLLGIVWIFLRSGRAATVLGRTVANVIGTALLGLAAWYGFKIMSASTGEARAASGLSLVVAAELIPRRWRAEPTTDIVWRAGAILAACYAAYTLLSGRG